MSTARTTAILNIAAAKNTVSENSDGTRKKNGNLSELFGRNVFTLDAMRERLPRDIYRQLEPTVIKGERLPASIADAVADSMKDWAIDNGATHYTHWFQPMNGFTAEKHDAFMTPTPNGQVINEFSGKMLISGEPDASSFPSGGIRSTFEARGYTAWDPTTPAFVIEGPKGNTLYIPTIFYSYTGEALDRKTPLLRSITAISKQALRILRLFGNTTATSVEPKVGAEQEYFLVDKRLAALRPDLLLTGRTLFGAKPAKGQEMEDHYFGAIPERVLAFMQEVEHRLYTLGIPARTRHNETAPAQYELAPVFEGANIATDHNMLTMDVLRRTAAKHGFLCILHEKPFASVNGSGKHNNWSLCDSEGNNLLNPGATPRTNAQFLVFLAAVLRAVHLHSVSLRLGTVGAGNDHRLGAQEAPPAIISVYLGEQLTQILESIIQGEDTNDDSPRKSIEIGVSCLPPLPLDTSDRNRTSPLAFTGNKFEFRAVGASQSIASVNMALNAAVACALDDIATELEQKTAAGIPINEATRELLARLFKEHMPVVFNGNGYTKEWEEEAARRGLPNLKNTVAALECYSAPSVMDTFMRHGILSEREILARQEIMLNGYVQSIAIEASLTSSMGRSTILPPALRCQIEAGKAAQLAKTLVGSESALPEETHFLHIRDHVLGLMRALDTLDKARSELKKPGNAFQRAHTARDIVLPAMVECRLHADALENLVDNDAWPLPKYAELLWLH